MAYRIEGLAPEPFAALFDLGDDELTARNARRVTADSPTAFPCRVSLQDAAPGEELVLLNHVSHDVSTPFRTAYAIYVRKGAEPASYVDEAPAYLDSRTLGLRGFDAEGMLKGGLLAMPGEADARIRELFAAARHRHHPRPQCGVGCFLARIERN